MKASENNFLTFLQGVVTGDEGFFVDRNDLIGSSVLATSVTYIADGNGYPVLNAAAGITAVAAVGFVVPRDYDEHSDKLVVRFAAKMAGATDTPTLTLVAKKMTVGSAPATLTADEADASLGTSDATTAALGTTAQTFEVVFTGQGLTRGQIVLLTLTSAAHATDALQLQQIGVSYRSTLVSYDRETTAGVALR